MSPILLAVEEQGSYKVNGAMDNRAPQAVERLRSTADQVREVVRLVEDDACGIDVIYRIRVIQVSLHQVKTVIVANHLHTCLTDAFEEGNQKRQAAAISEIASVFNTR